MSDLLEKFQWEEGRETLLRTLRLNSVVNDSLEVAEEIADRAELLLTPAGSALISEGGFDDDLYFILSGRLQVLVQGKEIALIGTGLQVGEMSLVDPKALRSATVRALKDTVTAVVSEKDFAAIAGRHPSLWRRMSQILGSHLRESNRFVARRNRRPRLFVTTSKIGRPLAEAISAQCQDTDAEIPHWEVNVAHLESTESLVDQLEAIRTSDFVALIIAPGDCAPTYGNEESNRDALFFLCGACLGVLGPERTIIVQPHDLEKDSPADSLSLPPHLYRMGPVDDLKADLASVCLAIRSKIEELHVR